MALISEEQYSGASSAAAPPGAGDALKLSTRREALSRTASRGLALVVLLSLYSVAVGPRPAGFPAARPEKAPAAPWLCSSAFSGRQATTAVAVPASLALEDYRQQKTNPHVWFSFSGGAGAAVVSSLLLWVFPRGLVDGVLVLTLLPLLVVALASKSVVDARALVDYTLQKTHPYLRWSSGVLVASRLLSMVVPRLVFGCVVGSDSWLSVGGVSFVGSRLSLAGCGLSSVDVGVSLASCGVLGFEIRGDVRVLAPHLLSSSSSWITSMSSWSARLETG